MGERYFSISEFAELVKVSPQSIYQRLKREDDEIHKYIKLQNGKKVISEYAVEIYSKTGREYDEIGKNDDFTVSIGSEIIEIYKKQIDLLTAEIEIKNKQIEELTAQLRASSERETNYQMLLNQQQQLNGIDKQRVLQLEAETQTTKKKKGLFSFFSRKDEKENKNNNIEE